MRVTEDSAETLEITHDDSKTARVLIGLSIVCAVFVAWMCLNGSYALKIERFWGLVAGLAIFLAAGLAIFEQSRFTFNRKTNEIIWQRRRALSKGGGTVPFAAVEDVISQTMGNRANPGRRIVLVLSDRVLPLTTAYAPGTARAYSAIQEQIRNVLGISE